MLTNRSVQDRQKLVCGRGTELVDGGVVDGADEAARGLLGHGLEHLVEVRGAQLVHKRDGALDVEHVRQVDARHDVVARRAAAHVVVVRHGLLGHNVRDAVVPVCAVQPWLPLAQVLAVALHNARAARRNRQERAATITAPRHCSHKQQKMRAHTAAVFCFVFYLSCCCCLLTWPWLQTKNNGDAPMVVDHTKSLFASETRREDDSTSKRASQKKSADK